MLQTLGIYIGRQFLVGAGIVLGLLVVVMFTVEVIEHLRKAGDRPEVTILAVMQLSLMKLPATIQKLWPFVFLFGAMLALTRLANSSELVVARAAGVSIWQILTPLLLVSATAGAILVTVVNPVGAALSGRYDQLSNRYFKGESSLISVSVRTGLWLREVNRTGHQVIHANSVSGDGEILNDVTIFTYGLNDTFDSRTDAERAQLVEGAWLLENARITSPDGPRQLLARTSIPTTLTFAQIVDSLAAPETLSFWELPSFIGLLEHSGFNALSHRLYWNSLLALPLLLSAMVLLAATFCIRLSRRKGGTGWVFFSGAMAGFSVFFITDLVEAFGSAGKLPIILAAWTPAAVTTMSAVAAMFHLEDG